MDRQTWRFSATVRHCRSPVSSTSFVVHRHAIVARRTFVVIGLVGDVEARADGSADVTDLMPGADIGDDLSHKYRRFA